MRFWRGTGAVGSPQSHNAYAYVLNSPLNFTDQTGLLPCGQSKFGANSQFCPPIPGTIFSNDLGCSLDGVVESCSTDARLADAGALAGVSSLFPGGANGTIRIWLSGGSVSTQDYGNWRVDPSSRLLTSFDGEWVTLQTWVNYLRSLADQPPTDQQRLAALKQAGDMAGSVLNGKTILMFYFASAGLGAAGSAEALSELSAELADAGEAAYNDVVVRIRVANQ